MSGRYSRNKGARVERELVHLLNTKGFTAIRVPLSGAAKGFKHDIIAAKEGKNINIEVKARGTGYTKIYKEIRKNSKNSLAYVLPDNRCVAISTDLSSLIDIDEYAYTTTKELVNFYNHVWGLKKLLQGADVLAIKRDREDFLFIKFL